MPLSAYQIDSGLVNSMVPVGFLMMVSLMVWLVRTINVLVTSVATLDARASGRIDTVVESVKAVAQGVEDIKEDRAALMPEWDAHVRSDALVAADVAFIKGKISTD